jgi:hypothetical protein
MCEQELSVETLRRLLAPAGEVKSAEIRLWAVQAFLDCGDDKDKAVGLLYERVYAGTDDNEFTNEAMKVFCALAVESVAAMPEARRRAAARVPADVT